MLYFLGTFTDLPPGLVFLIGILSGVAIGFSVSLPPSARSEDASWTPCWSRPLISVILRRIFQLGISPGPRPYLPRLFNMNIELFGVVTPLRNILMIGTTAVLLIVLVIVMNHTTLGVAMRGASENFVTACLMGARKSRDLGGVHNQRFSGRVVAIFWSARDRFCSSL